MGRSSTHVMWGHACKCTTIVDVIATNLFRSGHAAVSHDRREFVIDNGTGGFSLHRLRSSRFTREFPTGSPIKRYPKQCAFGENDSIVVGGSDHGAVYVFDRETGRPLDLLRHSDRGLVQTVAVCGSDHQVNNHLLTYLKRLTRGTEDI